MGMTICPHVCKTKQGEREKASKKRQIINGMEWEGFLVYYYACKYNLLEKQCTRHLNCAECTGIVLTHVAGDSHLKNTLLRLDALENVYGGVHTL